jgi:hypothetical protein
MSTRGGAAVVAAFEHARRRDGVSADDRRRLFRGLAGALTERDLVELLLAPKAGWPPGLAEAVESFARDGLAWQRQHLP